MQVWMRGIGQPARAAGQGSTIFDSAGGAEPSARASGQGGSFLGSLGIGTQQPAAGKGETPFKGKAHTLGVSPFSLRAT